MGHGWQDRGTAAGHLVAWITHAPTGNGGPRCSREERTDEESAVAKQVQENARALVRNNDALAESTGLLVPNLNLGAPMGDWGQGKGLEERALNVFWTQRHIEGTIAVGAVTGMRLRGFSVRTIERRHPGVLADQSYDLPSGQCAHPGRVLRPAD